MDIDPDAVRASLENAEANGFDKDRIDFTCGNLLDSNYIAGVSRRKGDFEKKQAENEVGAVSVDEDGTADVEKTAAVDRQYDIVVANILADVIMPLSAVVRPYMKEDGLFITSGIIDTKEEEVKAELLKNGFEIIDIIHMGEWVSIVCK